MTREELKEHCKKTVEQCEMWAIHRGEEPSGKVYEEHKAVLNILEQEPTEKPMCDRNICVSNEYNGIGCDKCIVNKAEQEPCETCGYAEGSPFCLQYCPYDAERKKEQEPTVQDKQAESEKYQKAFDDGYANGYAQARFDYEQEPCDDAISREQAIKVIRQITSRYTLAKESCGMGQVEWSDHLIKESDAIDGLNELSPVTPIQKTNYYGVKTVLLSEDNK